jgi:hypothetical protein
MMRHLWVGAVRGPRPRHPDAEGRQLRLDDWAGWKGRTRLKLEYTILCEDIRVEATGRLSLMGVMHNLVVPQVPVTMIKLAVLNHWTGEGQHLTEVRILTPDRRQTVAISQPSSLTLPEGGFADNVTVFINTAFLQTGRYVVQTLLDSTLLAEKELSVVLAEETPPSTPLDSQQVH